MARGLFLVESSSEVVGGCIVCLWAFCFKVKNGRGGFQFLSMKIARGMRDFAGIFIVIQWRFVMAVVVSEGGQVGVG